MKGEISEEALLKYSELAAEKLGADFAEGEETYDFTRCMRSNGTYYGTRGKCKKGSEAGAAEKKEGTGARGGREAVEKARTEGKKGGALRTARAEGKKAALAAARAEGGKKVSANNARARLLKEELVKVKDQMRGASPEVQNRLLQEASKRASERAAGGEGAAKPAPAKKPRASSSELRTQQQALFDAAKQHRAEAKAAEKAHKENEKRHKGSKSPESRKSLMETGRAWDKANTKADRTQRAWMKAHERWSKAAERERRAKMSPEQRAEARRIDKIIKERG